MGYFRKKLRRGEARAAKRVLAVSAAAKQEWQAAPDLPRDVSAKYFRLRAEFEDELLGLFGASRRVREDRHTEPETVRAISREIRWFCRHLIAPRRVPQDAVFWFIADDPEMCAHAWRLIHLIKQAGAKVLIESSDKPGRIVYRDKHQVAAIRFADAPRIRDAAIEIEARHG